MTEGSAMSRNPHTPVYFHADVRPIVEAAGKVFSPQRMTAANRKVGDTLVLKIATYIYERSLTRHKTADRLNAPHTGVLEFSRAVPAYTRRGGKIFSVVSGGKVDVTVQGVPGLARAYRPLDIYPRKAHALTIPISAEAYAKTAKKLSDAGWRLFVPKRNGSENRGVLMGTFAGVTKPLFALRRHVHIKRDPLLMPPDRLIATWAANGMREYMEASGL